MPAITTSSVRVRAADAFAKVIQENPTYVYIGGTSAWTDEQTPDDVKDSTVGRIGALGDIVGMKRIVSSDVISVLPRINWVSGNIYDKYSDSVDLINGKSADTGDFYEFYVMNSEFNIYKCINNSDRSISTVQPTGTSITPFQTPDGYVWKYMYTINASDAFRFMTLNWIPCYTLTTDDGTAQWDVQQAAVKGSVDSIEVEVSGANYTVLSPPTVTITGDGTGATAVAVVDPVLFDIQKIEIVSQGSGYTYTNVSIVDGGAGVGATAHAIVSPIKGHGADPRIELGATYKMVRATLEGDEGGLMPVGIDYRKAGLVSLPLSTSLGTYVAIGSVGLFSTGETLSGATSGATGDIVAIDTIRNFIYLNNVVGTFQVAEPVSSTGTNSTGALEVVDNTNLPLTDAIVPIASYEQFSGDPLYISHRTKIARDAAQTEEVRYILSF